MNYATYRARIFVQMELYVEFIPHCENLPYKLKLIEQVQYLSEVIASIDLMPYSFAKNDMASYYVTFESKINNDE